MKEPEHELQAQNRVCPCGKKFAEHSSLDELRACAIKFGGTVTEDSIDIPQADFAPPEGRGKG